MSETTFALSNTIGALATIVIVAAALMLVAPPAATGSSRVRSARGTGRYRY